MFHISLSAWSDWLYVSRLTITPEHVNNSIAIPVRVVFSKGSVARNTSCGAAARLLGHRDVKMKIQHGDPAAAQEQKPDQILPP